MIFGGIMQINVTIKSISEGALLVRDFSALFSYVSSITALIIVNLKRDLMPVILKQLYKFDGALLEYEDQVRESKRSQYVFVTKTCILLFPAVICIALSYVPGGRNFGPLGETLLWTSDLISLMVLIQVLGFLSYVHHNLATLNMAILSVFKNRPRRLSSAHRNYKHAVSSSVSRGVSLSDNTRENDISITNTNYSRIMPSGTPLNQHSVSSKILILRKNYNRIYDLLGIVNSIYGFPVLVELTQNFLILVGVSYFFLLLLLSQELYEHNPFLGFASVTNFSLWLLLSFLRLLNITFTCENLKTENKRLSDSMQKLLLQQDMAADSVHQLQLFSFQLLSSKMEFSAAGLFSVDLPYLYSSIAAIVTYFVVLLQIK
jgi:hypothetical protein